MRFGIRFTAVTLPCGNLGEILERNFVVPHPLVEIGEQRSSVGRNHGGLAVGSRKGADSSERLLVRGDQDFHSTWNRPCANRGTEEAVEALQLRLHNLLEVMQVGLRKCSSCARRPQASDHLRRTPQPFS